MDEHGDRGAAHGHEILRGTIERTVYHDPRTRYSVLRVRVAGLPTLSTAVGRAQAIEDGAEVELHGRVVHHPTHGQQFEFVRADTRMPTTEAGVRRRLVRYPGIQAVIAERIVRAFGIDALRIVAEEPDRLLEVEGIGKKKLEAIAEYHARHVGPVAELESLLLELDLPVYLAGAIFDRYGAEAVATVRTRPYRLARDVRGIGFATADRLARSLGLAADADERIEAGVVHALEQAESDGHCALPPQRLRQLAAELLGVEEEAIDDAVARLLQTCDLVFEGGLCFPHRLWIAERDVAERLRELGEYEHPPLSLPELPGHLARGQVDAVAAAARGGVVVLTGGPGTGKSTVVRHVIALCEHNRTPVMLAAPTGRAARRLSEATQRPASTLHRLLEVEGETGRFVHGPGSPLPPGLLVIDESSMIDVELMRAVLSALVPGHRLLLVGDVDQLPSVGPGNVLRDVLGAAEDGGVRIHVVRLQEIFRQALGSSIVTNAHRVLAGHRLAPDPGPEGEFFFVHAPEPARAAEVVLRLVTERIPRAHGLDPISDVQVLCPMHKGPCGTEAFNHALQEHHTSGRVELEVGRRGAGGRRFRLGDRVMQTRNDHLRGVFNGDIGVVASVDPEDGELVVDVDGVAVRYDPAQLASVRLGYAISIHKSQGSEFPAVVVPLLSEHHVMLRRNLLYTAITRARRLCVVVGDPEAVRRAISRSDAARRHTGLRARLAAAEDREAAPWLDPA